jgi:hypothetical protein
MNRLRRNGFFGVFRPEFDVFSGTLPSVPDRAMIERLARLGYASIGAVYVIAGLLAAAAGLHAGGSTRGQQGAFAFILHQPFGRAILGVIAIGLAGYTIWRLIAGFADSEQRGSDAKGIALRIGSIARGVVYAVIAVEVVRMIVHRASEGGGSDANTKHWTARLMDAPFGRWLVGLAGLAVVGGGAYQLYKALFAKLSKRLHLESMDARLRRNVVAVSRFGIGARGVVFIIIGGSLLVAALQFDPNAAHGTSGALQQLRRPFGGAPLVVVGIGLAAFGVYAFVNARYRSIRA